MSGYILSIDSTIKCFSNVCTHRGNILIDKPCFINKNITCNYHGKQFDTDGKFKYMPKCEGMINFPSAEDNLKQGWLDLLKHKINNNDSVIGIAASGTTPYVIGAIKTCRKKGILTGCITCNLNSPLGLSSEYPIEVVVGPEVVTGSSRMKAGTAQKLILNTISTTLMIKLGRVKGNKMIDMQLANNKLIDRAEKILMKELEIDLKKAQSLLRKNKSVRKSLESQNQK